MALTHSKKIFEEAKTVMVGGVSSPVRSFKAVGGTPLIIERGAGAKIIDVDRNTYTDYCLSWGALILGHSNKQVQKAVQKTFSHGTSFGTTTAPEVEMAKFITRSIPSIELIRFVNSGTEATMSAIRLARGFTKRNIIVKFDGCYHGHFDDLLITAGSGVAQLKQSSSDGITQNHIAETISLPYNNAEKAAETIERFHKNIACVIVEPVAGNMGVIKASAGFLKTLRDLTKKYNIVLIFDEIITGFRFNLGGAQSEFNIFPDLTCLGKIIGGGFPVGAYGGRKDIMQNLSPLGGVYQAGTFSGNPVVMSAGLATLEQLNASFYRKLGALSEKFALEVNRYFKQNRISCHMAYYKSMLSLRFQNQSVLNYNQAQNASSEKMYAKLFHFLLSKNIYWPPADLESFFISGVHSAKDLDKLEAALKGFFS